MINKIGAIVVLYHPTEEMFCNMLTYGDAIQDIIVMDNSETGVESHEKSVDELKKRDTGKTFHFYNMGGNKGLAEAFNKGLKIAESIGCDWCFTMDCDSSFQNDMVAVYREAEKRYGDSKIIAYAPQHDYDRVAIKRNDKVKKTTWSMTSGTMFRVKDIVRLGGFDPWFFVDGLDVELGYRLKKMGLFILRCNGAILNHVPARTVQKTVLGKQVKYGIAEPVRYYYQARADVRIMRMYFAPCAFVDLLKRLCKILLLFEEKGQYLRAWKAGIGDALADRGGYIKQDFKNEA